MGTIWLGGNEANSSLLHTSITACLSALLSLFLGSGLVAVGLLSAPISPSIRQRCKILVENPITSQALSSSERSFLYMPFMHSESALIHEIAVVLFTTLETSNTLGFELKHKKIVDRFGRYPHRNTILGRTSSAEELAFLKEPNSSF